MPANYYLSDLQPLLPFTPTDDDAPFPWQAEAASGHVLYLADDKGLWMRVLSEPEEPMNFEAITGFRPDELARKKAGAIYIYTLKDGGAILPFPFTATQLLELDQRTGGVFSERLHCGDETDELIAEIAQRNPRDAELARAVIYRELPPEHGATPAFVADSACTDPTPDPERRLALLRALGGSAAYKRNEWKFTGIAALVASEKSEGRKRSDEKTIRADLKEAAQNELEARRAGFGSGLGQR